MIRTCFSCNFYDECNENDVCYKDGYKQGKIDALEELLERVRDYCNNSAISDVEHLVDLMNEEAADE